MEVYIVWYKTTTVTNEVVTVMWGIYTYKEDAQAELQRIKNELWYYDSWIDKGIVQ